MSKIVILEDSSNLFIKHIGQFSVKKERFDSTGYRAQDLSIAGRMLYIIWAAEVPHNFFRRIYLRLFSHEYMMNYFHLRLYGIFQYTFLWEKLCGTSVAQMIEHSTGNWKVLGSILSKVEAFLFHRKFFQFKFYNPFFFV